MTRSFLLGALLVGIGMLAGVLVVSRRAPDDVPVAQLPTPLPAFSRRGFSAHAGSDSGHRPVELERRLDRLAADVEEEAAERRRLGEQLSQIASELAALRESAPIGERASAPRPDVQLPGAPRVIGGVASHATPEQGPPADAQTASERALIAAGIDSATATEIRRHRDEIALAEIDLRNQATREGWLNSPRFAEEMASIRGEQLSMRDEIGDDAYDLYLAALGHPNRVRVDEVLLDSPAAQAGLQAGDVVVRYGEARIFTPNELVDETHGGRAGETVRLEILRGGERIEIDVPRGPLGVRVAAWQGGVGVN